MKNSRIAKSITILISVSFAGNVFD